MEDLRRELSLAVGDSVQIGNYILTLVDLDCDVTGFRVDPAPDAAFPESSGAFAAETGLAVSRTPR